jgi:DNA uptake protein ComE-like DNA-binding protein
MSAAASSFRKMGATSPRSRFVASGFSREARGSVLVIVIWICLGLVALALYFANSMTSELRAADNRATETAARQALGGAVRYASYVLTQYGTNGAVPKISDYKGEAVLVGDAQFWFIGRNNDKLAEQYVNEPTYALVDEASKLNLNTATSAMLQALPIPGMTQEFADAIVAWRTANSQNAALQESTLTQLTPPRHNKGALYESVDELRLVYGATLDLLLGEDTNRNGALDPNEDDSDLAAPHDDQNGQLLAGLLEYVTAYSSEPATSASGSNRINVRTVNTAQNRQALQTLLTQRGIQQQRVLQIMTRVPQAQQGGATQTNAFGSVAEFMATTQLTADEFALIHTDLTATNATNGIATGLVNVNTASEAVLSAIPGIGADNATAIVAYRAQHQDELTSFAWLPQVLPAAAIRQAGPYLTDQSYQFSADIAAVGQNGRGYCREKVVFDLSAGRPRIVFRQDYSAYGWALGVRTRRILNGTDT